MCLETINLKIYGSRQSPNANLRTQNLPLFGQCLLDPILLLKLILLNRCGGDIRTSNNNQQLIWMDLGRSQRRQSSTMHFWPGLFRHEVPFASSVKISTPSTGRIHVMILGICMDSYTRLSQNRFRQRNGSSLRLLCPSDQCTPPR